MDSPAQTPESHINKWKSIYMIKIAIFIWACLTQQGGPNNAEINTQLNTLQYLIRNSLQIPWVNRLRLFHTNTYQAGQRSLINLEINTFGQGSIIFIKKARNGSSEMVSYWADVPADEIKFLAKLSSNKIIQRTACSRRWSLRCVWWRDCLSSHQQSVSD